MMRTLFTSAVAALALAGMVVGIATPADAQRYRGGYGYHGGYRGDSGGAAIVAGIVGLGLGAAIASDRGGYARGYAYAPPPPPYGYGYRGYCRSDWRWDGYRGRYVRVRYCD